MKGWSAEERGGHTFISLSLRDHRAPRQNRQTMAPVCARRVCVCVRIISDKGSPLSVFSSSPLSSHVPVVAAAAPFLLLCSLCPRCSEASPEMKAGGDKGR